MKKPVTFITTFLIIAIVGILGYSSLIQKNSKTVVSPIAQNVKDVVQKNVENATGFNTTLAQKPIFSLLLLGIDRRSRDEGYTRSDVMVLATINTKEKTVVFTSVPRDLWAQGGRINALYSSGGWESIRDEFKLITGIEPDKYILTDFKDFSWIVDAMGGVPVTVETTFTDSQFPVDETFEYQTVHFEQGPELLTGERALIFSRSRKGDNDNGDFGRMARQHLILKGMLDAVLSPKSIFNPMVIEKSFTTVTTGKMTTDLSLDDAKYLWSYYKDKDLYTFKSLFLDSNYLYTPPLDPEGPYGGAWVFVPNDPTFADFHVAVDKAVSPSKYPVETLVSDTTPATLNTPAAN